MPAVAEDRAIVGERRDLAHAMRNVHDRKSLGPKTVEDRVDPLDVRRRERRGRLVEDQELRRASERPRDLDHLAARERKIAHDFVRMNVLAMHAGKQALGAAALGAPVDQSEPARRLGRTDVLGDT